MQCQLPERLELAFKQTPIVKLETVSKEVGRSVYVKRDDMTGMEWSGNKIRKLEYCLYDALEKACDVIITCGAVQSNHARATAVAARRLGLDVHLVLRGDAASPVVGNYLVDVMMGAEITVLSEEAFKDHEAVMTALAESYAQKGRKAYILPIGASNAIGNFGYMNAYFEMLEQEAQMGLHFDAVACAVGSGGTYAGLFLGNHCTGYKKAILGYSVGGSTEQFTQKVLRISAESLIYMSDLNPHLSSNLREDRIVIRDDFCGEGYAQTNTADIACITEVARTEGIIFDPVYTGKAFHGLLQDLRAGLYPEAQSILFIHTGGFFGLESYAQWFTGA